MLPTLLQCPDSYGGPLYKGEEAISAGGAKNIKPRSPFDSSPPRPRKPEKSPTDSKAAFVPRRRVLRQPPAVASTNLVDERHDDLMMRTASATLQRDEEDEPLLSSPPLAREDCSSPLLIRENHEEQVGNTSTSTTSRLHHVATSTRTILSAPLATQASATSINDECSRKKTSKSCLAVPGRSSAASASASAKNREAENKKSSPLLPRSTTSSSCTNNLNARNTTNGCPNDHMNPTSGSLDLELSPIPLIPAASLQQSADDFFEMAGFCRNSLSEEQLLQHSSRAFQQSSDCPSRKQLFQEVSPEVQDDAGDKKAQESEDVFLKEQGLRIDLLTSRDAAPVICTASKTTTASKTPTVTAAKKSSAGTFAVDEKASSSPSAAVTPAAVAATAPTTIELRSSPSECPAEKSCATKAAKLHQKKLPPPKSKELELSSARGSVLALLERLRGTNEAETTRSRDAVLSQLRRGSSYKTHIATVSAKIQKLKEEKRTWEHKLRQYHAEIQQLVFHASNQFAQRATEIELLELLSTYLTEPPANRISELSKAAKSVCERGRVSLTEQRLLQKLQTEQTSGNQRRSSSSSKRTAASSGSSQSPYLVEKRSTRSRGNAGASSTVTTRNQHVETRRASSSSGCTSAERDELQGTMGSNHSCTTSTSTNSSKNYSTNTSPEPAPGRGLLRELCTVAAEEGTSDLSLPTTPGFAGDTDEVSPGNEEFPPSPSPAGKRWSSYSYNAPCKRSTTQLDVFPRHNHGHWRKTKYGRATITDMTKRSRKLEDIAVLRIAFQHCHLFQGQGV
eukprot:GSA25T00008495001.1